MAARGKIGYWLFKQEPSCYCYADLQRDGRTVWDGVASPLARRHLAKVRAGDRVLLYHTGKAKAVVGELVVTTADADKIEVAPVRPLPPVTLAQIKDDEQLAGWDLIRLPRLSVVPVTEAQWRRVLELSESGVSEPERKRAGPSTSGPRA